MSTNADHAQARQQTVPLRSAGFDVCIAASLSDGGRACEHELESGCTAIRRGPSLM